MAIRNWHTTHHLVLRDNMAICNLRITHHLVVLQDNMAICNLHITHHLVVLRDNMAICNLRITHHPIAVLRDRLSSMATKLSTLII